MDSMDEAKVIALRREFVKKIERGEWGEYAALVLYDDLSGYVDIDRQDTYSETVRIIRGEFKEDK